MLRPVGGSRHPIETYRCWKRAPCPVEGGRILRRHGGGASFRCFLHRKHAHVRTGFIRGDTRKSLREKLSVEELDGAGFDRISQNKVAVIDVWAPWCGPCRMVSPIVERLSTRYNGKVQFGKLNSDDHGEKAGQLGIMSIPTLLFYKEGKLVDRIVGAYPEEVIDEHIRKLL
jgi:thioredoxin 1